MQTEKNKKKYPLSDTQKTIWLEQSLSPETVLLNIAGYITIKGSISYSIFKKALNRIIKQNDVFNITFFEDFSEPYFKFESKKTYNIKLIKFTKESKVKDLCLAHMQKDAKIPFDIYSKQLYRTYLYEIGSGEFIWYFVMHHILMDSWAVAQFVQQVSITYNYLARKEKKPIPSTRSYLSLLADENTYRHSLKYDEDKVYWNMKLKGISESVIEQKSLLKSNYQLKRKSLILNQQKYNQIEAFVSKNHSSVFQYFLALIGYYFCKRYQVSEMLISYNVLNRRKVIDKKTLGLCFNTLPFKFQFNNKENVSQLLCNIKKELEQDYRHHRFPSREIYKNIPYDGSQSIVISYEQPDFDVKFKDSPTTIQMIPPELPRSILAIYIRKYHQNSAVTIDFDFNTQYFDEIEIDQIPEQVNDLITRQLTNPSELLSYYKIIPEDECHRIIEGFNSEYDKHSNERTLVELFESQVLKTPKNIALIVNNQSISYSELNIKANQIAHFLREKGVLQNSIVALLLTYSEDMVASVLGVLKAGGAYLPIDPKYPEKLINNMLQQSNCQYMITENEYSVYEHWLVPHTITIQDTMGQSDLNPKRINQSTDLAYVIFTSGSTGEPKGVMIQHVSVANVLDVWIKEYGLSQNVPTLLQMSSFSHDVFTGNWVKTLLTGGCLVLCNNQERQNYAKLHSLLLKYKVNILDTTPSLIMPFLEYIKDNELDISSLKTIISGSDICSLEDYRKLISEYGEKISVYNSYGVTEATIYSSHYKEQLISIPTRGNLPIGKPFKNTKFYILNKNMEIVPIGVSGDLYIGGTSLSCGYINRPELTADRFLKNPFCVGETIYQTGDIARWLNNGNVEFLGRADFQIKLRGYRIESSEIEYAIDRHPQISKSVVVCKKSDRETQQLFAYYQAGKPIPSKDLRDYLRDLLPEHMIPSIFIWIDTIPLSSNGKVNRKLLIDIKEKDFQAKHKLKPENLFQQRILEIWEFVLEKKDISIDDDFFEMGGDSLDAIKISTKLEEIGISIQATDLYFYRNIKSLESRISKEQKVDNKINNFRDAEQLIYKDLHLVGRFLTFDDNTVEEKYIVLFIKDMKNYNKEELVKILNINCSERIFPNYIIPSSEKDAITKVDVKNQNIEFKKIINKLIKQENIFYNKIKRSSKNCRMSLIGIQKNVLNLYPKNLFGSIIRYTRNLDIDRLNKVASKIIEHQTLLRSVIIKNGKSIFWRTYNSPKEVKIPFIDLSKYSIPLKRRLFEDILPEYFLNYDRENDFLYRLVLVKENLKNYYLITVADHLICDDFSKEALAHLLKEMYEHDSLPLELVPYENYSKMILAGPVNISEGEIIKRFNLEEYIQSSNVLQNRMLKYKEPFNQNFSSNIFLKHKYDTSKKWELSIILLAEICRHFLHITKIPLMILYNGRSYNNVNYFNTIGNFNDYIPVIIDTDTMANNEIPDFVYEKIRLAVKHCINFTSLIYDKSLSVKYKKINRLAGSFMPSNKNPNPGIFLDYKIKDKFEDINLSKNPELYSQWIISGWFFTIKYLSDQYLTISMNVPSNMNRNKLKSFIDDTANKICKDYPLTQNDQNSIKEVGLRKHYPLSSIQKSIYIEQQKAPEKTHYHISGSARIYGKLDIYRLKNTFKTLVQYQDILRTGFKIENTEVIQFINNDVDIIIEKCRSGDINEFCRPFNIESPPLFRIGFYKMEENRYELFVDIHHLIADQISIQIILKDIIKLYHGQKLVPLAIQYKDYSEWQKNQLETDGFKSQRQYWLKELEGGIPRIDLPLDKERPEILHFMGNTVSFIADSYQNAKLLEFSEKVNVSPFICLTACLAILLKKYTLQTELVFGVPMSTRINKNTEMLIGAFVNTAIIIIKILDTDSGLRVINKAKYKLKKASENIEFPLESICKELGVLQKSRNSIFDVLLVKQISKSDEYRMDDLTINILDEPVRNTSKTDISFIVKEGMDFSIEYNTDLFEETNIRLMGKWFIKIIDLVLDNPNIKIMDLLLMISPYGT